MSAAARLAPSTPTLRLVPGGRPARRLRPLLALEALSLAWIAGLCHDIATPWSEVLIDEGSIPVELPSDVASGEVLRVLERRGYLVRQAGADHDTLLSLTPAGEAELAQQRRAGHLAALLPVPAERWVDESPEYDQAAYEADCQAIAAAEWCGGDL